MKKQTAIITAALLGLALPACHKTETASNSGQPAAPAVVPVETRLRETYGFAAQMPANMESYADFYQLGKLFSDIKQSKTWASIKANPLFAPVLKDASFQQAVKQSDTNPEAVKWKAILKDALGNETFVAMAPGSGAQMRIWMQINGAMRGANLKQALAGAKSKPDPGAQLRAILPYVKDLDVPPMILGFKMTSQKAALNAELLRGEQNLPPFIETGTFTLGANQSFKSISVIVGKALPPQQQGMLKMVLAMNMGDAQKADEAFQALLSRHLEIAYGYVGDYFIVSIGPDHSHLKLAANYGDSLLSRPEVQAAADYSGKPVLSFSWTSSEMMAACQQEFQLMALYNKVKPELGQMLAPNDAEKLETDIKRLDDESKNVFKHDFAPMMSVMYRDHGLHGEVYGGMKSTGTAAVMKFSQVPTDSTFFWVDQMSNQAKNDAIRVWFEDFAATVYDTFSRVGLSYLTQEQQMQFTMFQTMALPRITELYHITRDQFTKSLGLESAFAMDLNGEIPEIPGAVTPEIHAGGKLMRMAYLSDVRDRALLAQSWGSYFKLAGDIAQMVPQGAMFAAGLPQPTNENVDGISLSYYPVPMLPPGDLLPNIAVTDKTFVASLSRSYSLDLSKAAAKPAAGKPMVLDVRINMKPAYDFADKWLALAAQNPDVFFKGNVFEAANFKKSEPDIAALLHSLRAFDGISVQTYEENGLPRISSVLRWDEK